MTSGTKGEWFVHVALFLSVTHFRTVSKQFSPPWTAGALSEKRSHLFSPSLTWSLEPGSCYSGVSGTVSVSMRVCALMYAPWDGGGGAGGSSCAEQWGVW